MRSRSSLQSGALALRAALVIWVVTVVLNGASAEVIPANNLPENTGGWIELLQEPPDTQPWSLETALNAPSSAWKPITSSVLNFSFDPAAYWVRFTINNPTDTNIRLIFDVAQPLQDYIDAWILNEDGAPTRSWQTGDRRPTSNRPFLYRAFAFPISIAPDTL